MERYGVNSNIKAPINSDEDAMKFFATWDGQLLDDDDDAGILPPLYEVSEDCE